MVKKAYSVETKLACIEMKKTGKSNKVIMDTLGIKNASQVKMVSEWWSVPFPPICGETIYLW